MAAATIWPGMWFDHDGTTWIVDTVYRSGTDFDAHPRGEGGRLVGFEGGLPAGATVRKPYSGAKLSSVLSAFQGDDDVRFWTNEGDVCVVMDAYTDGRKVVFVLTDAPEVYEED